MNQAYRLIAIAAETVVRLIPGLNIFYARAITTLVFHRTIFLFVIVIPSIGFFRRRYVKASFKKQL
jgi:hypothetical protein